MPQNAKNYTDPELREQVKNEVQQGDKGGKPGQWSARKAQMTASEYKARGGDYTTSKDEKKPEQKHLDKWTNEEWQTKEGSGTAKQDDGTRKRYLPKKAWEELDEGEKEATEEKKMEGSKAGKQFVANTGEAKRKRGEENRKKEEEGKTEQEPEENEENEEEEYEDTENDEDYEEDGEDLDGENEESGDNNGSEDEDEEQDQQADEKKTETNTPEGEQPEKKRQRQD
ncbi:uncharacterized protein BDW70DRAFT_163005 [Aspergillus foveolatus]|uniref:uncharacterized protein n=1 Tax=Aspergillus foveolatus TaxID=210207 RepID=UPI003CCCBB16